MVDSAAVVNAASSRYTQTAMDLAKTHIYHDCHTLRAPGGTVEFEVAWHVVCGNHLEEKQLSCSPPN